jgi:hypothetical protein
MLIVMKNLCGSTKEDLATFANDKSGRLKIPAPGTEETPENERYWASFHRVLHDYLARTQETNKLAESYQRLFGECLVKYPVDQWTSLRLYEFLRKDMAEAAISSLSGTRFWTLTLTS